MCASSSCAHRPVAADQQPPVAPALAQARDDVGQQQRVLLGVQSPDREQRQLAAVVATRERLVGVGQVVGGDQRDGRREHPSRVSLQVLALELRADDDHRVAPREQPPDRLEHVGAEVHPAPIRPAAAHVQRHVLANAEDQPPPAQRGEQRERHRVRIGTEHPDGVDLVEQPPEAHERDDQRARHRHGCARLS